VMPEPPPENHRAWAEMIRTVAAICTVLITFGLFLDKLGVW
jgi:hypothetical protein